MKFNVTLVTGASTVVTVEAPEGTAPEAIRELALKQDDLPTLCHQCAGGGRSGSAGLTLGDEWDIPDGEPLTDYISEAGDWG